MERIRGVVRCYRETTQEGARNRKAGVGGWELAAVGKLGLPGSELQRTGAVSCLHNGRGREIAARSQMMIGECPGSSPNLA